MTTVSRVHHFAFSTTDADSVIDLHERVLGLVLVRRIGVTLRGRQCEELAFGSTDDPDEAFLVAYCLGSAGPTGRRGSNGPHSANLAVPSGSLGYWRDRLHDNHIEHTTNEVLDTKRVSFTHSSGVLYTLVETDAPGAHAARGDVDPTYAIPGLHSVTISLMDVRETHTFLLDILDATHIGQDLASGSYELGDGASGAGIELLHEPYRAPGTWTYAVGTPHHIGVTAADSGQRERLRTRLLDAGYVDVSPIVPGPGSSAMWVRAAGGALVAVLCRDDL